MRIKRREFLSAAVVGTTGAFIHPPSAPQQAIGAEPASLDPTAQVPLGAFLKTSRIGCGTGMKGWGRQANQTRMGRERFEALLTYAYDQGIRLFDTADLYGTHPYIGRVLKSKPRDDVQIVTKIWVRPAGLPEPERPPADVVVRRFLQELQMDYLDLVQLHCMTSPNWPQEQQEQMAALARLKQEGLIRAHGVSCHSLPALQAAAEEPWVDVIHARVNPFQVVMDDTPDKVVAVLQKAHANGKGVIGMKLNGEGRFNAEQRQRTVEWVMGLGCVDAFIVGFEKPEEINEFKSLVARALLARAGRSA